MRTTTKPLLSLTAADLMTENVVTVPQGMSLQGAAHRLSQAGVSGAPVVDTEGRCVGVLSATDFVAWAEKGERASKRDGGHVCCAYSAWQILEHENLPIDEVTRYMTADPVTVPPGMPIGQLARMMLDAHIHRVFVVNHEGCPVGVVSSTDVLAAVAYAEEQTPALRRW
jgi:CBS-domain-containing membrane protein